MKRKLNRVLLIDDDEPTNFLNRMILEEAGCANDIVIMHNAREALQFLAQTPLKQHGNDGAEETPELIFLDINMPAMDGWEFLEKYNQLQPHQKKSTVVVMLTTSFNPEDELRARTTPCISDFLNKPLTTASLQNVLNAHFG
jgi:CheY-like chemotaxis protein